MSKVARFMREVQRIAGDLWNSVEPRNYCCGVALEPEAEYMPTASSCCGVRV